MDKELCDYVKSNIKSIDNTGGSKVEIQLKTSNYSLKDILDLIDYFSSLNFKIEAYGLNSEIVHFIAQWTDKEIKSL